MATYNIPPITIRTSFSIVAASGGMFGVIDAMSIRISTVYSSHCWPLISRDLPVALRRLSIFGSVNLGFSPAAGVLVRTWAVFCAGRSRTASLVVRSISVTINWSPISTSVRDLVPLMRVTIFGAILAPPPAIAIIGPSSVVVVTMVTSAASGSTQSRVRANVASQRFMQESSGSVKSGWYHATAAGRQASSR